MDDLKRKIIRLKEKFPKNTRLKLISMDDIQAPPSGTFRTVLGVYDIGMIFVEWDNGSTLSLIPEEDKFKIVRQ